MGDLDAASVLGYWARWVMEQTHKKSMQLFNCWQIYSRAQWQAFFRTEIYPSSFIGLYSKKGSKRFWSAVSNSLRDDRRTEHFLFAVQPSASALWLWMQRWGYKRRRLTGRVKVDVKAQSHSKLYNRAEESTWQSHLWDREKREMETVKGKKKKKRQPFVSV